MAFTQINIGTVPNDGSGDSIRASFIKVNDNFNSIDLDEFTTTDDINDILGDYVLLSDYDANNSVITGALSNKAPLTHSHSINDITGLSASLSSKASTSYTNSQISSINNTIAILDNNKIDDVPDDSKLYIRRHESWINTGNLLFKARLSQVGTDAPIVEDIFINTNDITYVSVAYISSGLYAVTFNVGFRPETSIITVSGWDGDTPRGFCGKISESSADTVIIGAIDIKDDAGIIYLTIESF